MVVIEPIQTLSYNSFSFALHNVIDHIPQGEMPRPGSPVLDFVSSLAHDDVHSDEVEQLHLIPREVVENTKVSYATVALSDVVEQEHSQPRGLVESPKFLDATATHLSPLAHNDVLESYFELVSSAGMELALVHTDHHVVEHDDVHSSSPTGPFRTSFLETVTEERSQIESFVQDVAPDSLA